MNKNENSQLSRSIIDSERKRLVISIGAALAGLILAYAYFTYDRGSLSRRFAAIFYFGMLIAYVKANTPSSWLSVFKFSILDQLSTPRSTILLLLPILSPIAGIILLHALA